MGSESARKTSGSQEPSGGEAEAEKPEKITIMVDGTFQATKEEGQEEWVKKWEELTGIKLEIIQPDHSSYYDVLGQTFASGPENWPDVVILSSTYYSGYAARGRTLGYDGGMGRILPFIRIRTAGKRL